MSILKCALLTLLGFAIFSTAPSTAADKPDDKKPDDKKPAETKPAEPKKKDPKDMKADEANEAGFCPVCKGEFKPVYHFEYKDKEYHFRTRKCCDEFKADPTKFGAVGKDWKSSLPPPEEKKDDKKDPKKPK